MHIPHNTQRPLTQTQGTAEGLGGPGAAATAAALDQLSHPKPLPLGSLVSAAHARCVACAACVCACLHACCMGAQPLLQHAGLKRSLGLPCRAGRCWLMRLAGALLRQPTHSIVAPCCGCAARPHTSKGPAPMQGCSTPRMRSTALKHLHYAPVAWGHWHGVGVANARTHVPCYP